MFWSPTRRGADEAGDGNAGGVFAGGVRLNGEQLRTLLLLAILFAALASALLFLRPVLRRLGPARRARGPGRTELERQKQDILRSVRMMIQQMEYDAEVLRLLRHIRACRREGREEELAAAIEELVRKERAMMDRVDRAQELEDHLRRRYGVVRAQGTGEGAVPGAGEGGGTAQTPTSGGDFRAQSGGSGVGGTGARASRRPAARTPEELRADILAFINALERIRAGETQLLEEKIGFFESWVESPERERFLRLLRAMELFLDKGDSSALEELSKKGGRRAGLS